jgi:hypothetical protein
MKTATAPTTQYFPGYTPPPGTATIPAGRLTSPVLFDKVTVIARSKPHDAGTVTAAGVDVGGPPTINVTPADFSPGAIPPLFVSPPANTREIYTCIRKFNLKIDANSCNADKQDPRVPPIFMFPNGFTLVRAGVDPLIPSPGGIGVKSPGKVQSANPGAADFSPNPARSFFQVKVEVELPPVGSFPGATLGNDDPMLIENYELTKLPPQVVYIHGGPTAVPVKFRTAGSNGGVSWNVGDVFGYLVFAGHGADFSCDQASVDNLLDKVFGPLGNLRKEPSIPGNNVITVNGYSDIITFDKPVAYYRFEETTGDKTKNFGTGGTADDGLWKVGSGPDDSSAGTASVEAGPRPPDFKGFDAGNNAGKFLGPDATIWVDAQGQLLNNLAAFSLEYWVRPANRVSDPTTFGTRIGIVGQNDAVEYGFIDPNTIQIWTPGGGSLNTAYSFPDNTWHHVATIATGSDIRNYFDGVLVGTGGSAAANYGSSTFNVHIGGGGVYDGTGNFFTGDIDEVAIFDKAIPAERIVQHFKAGKEGAFTVPFIGKPTGTITDFTIEVNDFAPIIADTNTIVLSLNGTPVTPTSVTKSGTTTQVKYAPANPFPSQSVQNTRMSINDTNGVTYSDAGSFTVSLLWDHYGVVESDQR